MRRKMSQIFGVVVLSIMTSAITTNVPAAQTSSSHFGRSQGQFVFRLRNVDGSVRSELVTPLATAGEVVCDAALNIPITRLRHVRGR